MAKALFVIFVSSTLIACGGGGSSSGGSGNGSSSGGSSSSNTSPYSGNSVILQAEESNVAASAPVILSKSNAAPTCTVVADNYFTDATCITPVSVRGQLTSVHLGATGHSSGGTRLLGADENETSEGEILGNYNFDLFHPIPLVTNNTLREEYSDRTQYDSITIDSNYYHIQFPITFNSGDTTKWVTMHLAMYGQPFEESDAVLNAIENCGLTSQDSTTSRFLAVNTLDDMTFERGDYLFCVKDNQSDECEANDFQWIDTQNTTFVSSRPESPRQSHWLANSPVDCSGDGGRVNFNFGPFGLFAEIETQNRFKMWADYSHGEISQQWPDERDPFADSTIADDPEIAWVEPFLLYYYNDCSDGVCSNEITTGTELEVTLNFDITNMIFVEEMTEENILAETDLAIILAKVHTVTQWGFDKKSEEGIVGFDVVDLSTMRVTPNLSFSNDTNPPEQSIVYCSELDPNNADEDGCGDNQ